MTMDSKKKPSNTQSQLPTLPLQVLVGVSHDFPVSKHLGPAVFGETSPSFACAKAAINFPYLEKTTTNV